MLPNRDQALNILNEAYERNTGPWREHSIIVAKCAYEISRHCDGMDAEKAYILGLLHDIGRREGVTNLAHVIDGYHYLMTLGYDEAARICITHSFAIKDINTCIGNMDVSYADLKEICDLIDGYEYDDYDTLIQLCDSIAVPDKSVNIEVRMNDVKERYGYYPENKWNEHIKIKEYFENRSGLNIDCLAIEC